MSAEAAKSYGAALWLGEWGWFGDPTVDGAKVQRFVAAQDRLGVGGAFWVWRQGCGSPETGDDATSSGNLVSIDCATGELSPPPAGFARAAEPGLPAGVPGPARLADVRRCGPGSSPRPSTTPTSTASSTSGSRARRSPW